MILPSKANIDFSLEAAPPRIITLSEMSVYLPELIGEKLFENQAVAYKMYSAGKVSIRVKTFNYGENITVDFGWHNDSKHRKIKYIYFSKYVD